MQKPNIKSDSYSYGFFLTAVGLIVIVAFVTLFSFQFLLTRSQEGHLGPKRDIKIGEHFDLLPTPPVTITPFVKKDLGLLFVQKDQKSNFIWKMNSGLQASNKLNLKDAYRIWNYPQAGKSLIKLESSNGVIVYDLVSNEIKEISEVVTSNYIGNIILSENALSPDGKYLVYHLSFTPRVCNPGSICPEVDPYPENNKGFYSLNLETNDKIYLGDFRGVNNWSADSKTIYISEGYNYHQFRLAGGQYQINVVNGIPKLIQRSVSEIDFVNAYLIEEKGVNNLLIADQKNQTSRYVILKDKKEYLVEDKEYSEIPPYFVVSPDRKNGIYKRLILNKDNNPYYEYLVINFETLSKEVILKDSISEKMKIDGLFWYDNEKIVYSLGSVNNSNKKSNIYSFNLENKSITQITQNNISYITF